MHSQPIIKQINCNGFGSHGMHWEMVLDMGMILVKGNFQSTHSLLDSILECPFGLLEVVLALVHCPKVTVVGEHLQYGHDHGINDAENADAGDSVNDDADDSVNDAENAEADYGGCCRH